MVNNPDSLDQRASSMRKSGRGGFGGKEIQKILGIEDEGPNHPGNKKPLKLMDLVLKTMEDEGSYEDEEEEDINGYY